LEHRVLELVLDFSKFCGPLAYMYKVKIKITLQQATKAQKGSRGIAILFL
jgi:hypothetical protein